MVDERILRPVKLQSPRAVVFGLFPRVEKGRVSGMEVECGEGSGNAGGGLRTDRPIERNKDKRDSPAEEEDADVTLDTIVVGDEDARSAEKGKNVVRVEDVEERENAGTERHGENDEEYVENEDPEDSPRAAAGSEP
jgi:hypothetical protein